MSNSFLVRPCGTSMISSLAITRFIRRPTLCAMAKLTSRQSRSALLKKAASKQTHRSGRSNQPGRGIASRRQVRTRVSSDHLWRLSKGAQEGAAHAVRSGEHTSEPQSPVHLVCRSLLEKKKKNKINYLSDKKNLFIDRSK